jgi:hypothetical protein
MRTVRIFFTNLDFPRAEFCDLQHVQDFFRAPASAAQSTISESAHGGFKTVHCIGHVVKKFGEVDGVHEITWDKAYLLGAINEQTILSAGCSLVLFRH